HPWRAWPDPGRPHPGAGTGRGGARRHQDRPARRRGPAGHGQRDGRHAADRALPDVQRGAEVPRGTRRPHRAEPGGQLHHQPGDAGLLGDGLPALRHADRAVGRASGHARPAVGTLGAVISAVSQGAIMDAHVFRAWIVSAAGVIEANRDHLTQLDAAIGDADHGINLSRGFTAVLGALDSAAKTPGAILTLTGNTLISKVGGASGPLYGTAFRRAGKALGGAADEDLPALSAALEAALAGVQQLGAARGGAKTMGDAPPPPTRAFNQAVTDGASQDDALASLAEAAQAGAVATIPLQALKGRA